MNNFSFHSALPPEKIPELMQNRLERSQIHGDILEKIFVKWNKDQFTVFHTEQRGFRSADGWQRTRNGYVIGSGKQWRFSPVLRGRLYSDRAGGSILEGRFVIHPAGIWLALAMMAIASVSGYLETHSVKQILLYDVGIALLFMLGGRNKPQGKGAAAILSAMRETFEEIS